MTQLQRRVLESLVKPMTIRELYYAVYPNESIIGRGGAGRRSGVARAIDALIKLKMVTRSENQRPIYYSDEFVYTRSQEVK